MKCDNCEGIIYYSTYMERWFHLLSKELYCPDQKKLILQATPQKEQDPVDSRAWQ